MTIPTTRVHVPTPAAAKVYPPERGRAVGVFIRDWAREQYGDDGIRERLTENLGVSPYRPTFIPSAHYGNVMAEAVDRIVECAQRCAQRVPPGASRLPVIAALRQATSGKGR